MPVFEDGELKRGEKMPEELKEGFLAKRKRLADLREEELKELFRMMDVDPGSVPTHLFDELLVGDMDPDFEGAIPTNWTPPEDEDGSSNESGEVDRP